MKGLAPTERRPPPENVRPQRYAYGRGNSKPTTTTTALKSLEVFKGLEPTLPILDYGRANKDNRPIEFLASLGEYTGVKYKSTIAPVFWNIPPTFGSYEIEPIAPLPINGEPTSIILVQEYLHIKKNWINVRNDTIEQRKSVFCLVYGQLSESSRCEVQDDELWKEKFEEKDLIYLVTRIRATHVAKQSGNPSQDKERVRSKWSHLRMAINESSFSFRTRVENYQLERIAVGLEELPDEEAIIGILNRLDMSRYGNLVSNYLDNERRGICEIPNSLSKLWKELKDANVIRFRGAVHPTTMESAFLTTAAPTAHPQRRMSIPSGRGRGGGRQQSASRGPANPRTPIAPTAVTPLTCWTCGAVGHRSNMCPERKPIHYTEVTDVSTFLSTVECFDPSAEEDFPESSGQFDQIFVSSEAILGPQSLLLDTQASTSDDQLPTSTYWPL